MRRPWSKAAGALAASALVLAAGAAAAVDRLALDWGPEAVPGGALSASRGRLRLSAAVRRGHLTGTRLAGPGRGPLESWHVGQLAVHWGAGATALPRAAGSLAAVSAGGRGALRGGAATLRLGRGRLLLAAGNRAQARRTATPRRAAIAAFWRGGVGVLVAGGGPTPLTGSFCGRFRRRDLRGELELAPAGAERGLRARLAAEPDAAAATLDFAWRAAEPAAPGAAARRGEVALELVIRGSPAGIPVAIGARADLADTRRGGVALADRGRLAAAPATRLRTELALPVSRGAAVSVRGEIRAAAERDRSRLHAGVRTGLAHAAVDWTAGGGILVQLRCRWDLPAGVTLESGVATWSGPLAATGAVLDLPRIPEHGLEPRFAAPGQETTFLLHWQAAQVRVRLGLATRRSHDARLDVRIATRVDLALAESERDR